MQNDIRINARNLIFREVISNTLMHREYTNPYPTKFVIESDQVYTENATLNWVEPDNKAIEIVRKIELVYNYGSILKALGTATIKRIIGKME